jgi:lysozyme
VDLKNYIAELMGDEGFRIDPYLCPAGHWTGGVGHKMTQKDWKDFDKSWSRSDKISFWTGRFTRDLDEAVRDVIQLLTEYDINATKDQINVLVNMRFNLGLAGLKKFKRMLSALKDGDLQRVSDEMIDSKWHRDFVRWNGGKDTEDLRSRRLANQMLGVV